MLGEEAQKLCLQAAKLHLKFADKIVELVNKTQETGEPIVQSMEYRYPHQGYERIDNQFFLGENLLVCPVIEKGARTRKVVLPEGQWKYCDGIVYNGGKEIVVSAPLSVLPYFNKIVL
jgi:alpha-glucosidase (family GH31 glycosyl hydrolase)